MINRVLGRVAVVAIAITLAGCVMHRDRHYDDRRGPPSHSSAAGPDARVNVPPGHMPPPGQCRIWYPDRPPGQQPAPGDCRELRHRVPAGAALIRGR